MVRKSPGSSHLLSYIRTVPSLYLITSTLIILFIGFCLFAPNFATITNILNVLRRSSYLFMLCCGQTLTVLLGGMDLSQGSAVGLVSVITGLSIMEFGVAVGVVIGLLAGIASALVNSLLITKAKVQPIIVTLGTLFGYLGITFIIRREPILGLPMSFSFIGAGMVGPIPVPVILFAVVAVIFYFLLKKTTLGRAIYAIGGNEVAARLSGIKIERTINHAWALNGALVALGSIILTSRVGEAQPWMGGFTILLESFAATVIGGTSLAGGVGGVVQVILGVLFIGFLVNGLILLGMNQFVREAVLGGLIIAAVWFGSRGR
jgi:ribose transport system permease protein